MARPTLFAHRKFLKLSSLVGDEAKALGHLEYLWHTANESGDDRLGDADDVEAVARWRGQRGHLTAALETAGFVDKLADGSYQIHDYWHHCPTYVQKRKKREEDRRKRNGGGEPKAELNGEAKKPAAAKAELIPEDFDLNNVNRTWLEGAGLTETEIEQIVDEFTRWARNSDLRRANWQLCFQRNPVVKGLVGRAKVRTKKGEHIGTHRLTFDEIRAIQERDMAEGTAGGDA